MATQRYFHTITLAEADSANSGEPSYPLYVLNDEDTQDILFVYMPKAVMDRLAMDGKVNVCLQNLEERFQGLSELHMYMITDLPLDHPRSIIDADTHSDSTGTGNDSEGDGATSPESNPDIASERD